MSMFAPPGENYKFIDLPLSNYASSSFDKVVSGGKMVGASMFSGYSWNERKMLSLGFVEEQYAKPGTQLTLVWGEENGGTKKTTVERHKQTEIRVVVGPTPYASRRARPISHRLAHGGLKVSRPSGSDTIVKGEVSTEVSDPEGLTPTLDIPSVRNEIPRLWGYPRLPREAAAQRSRPNPHLEEDASCRRPPKSP